jgi:hypothetical protein
VLAVIMWSISTWNREQNERIGREQAEVRIAAIMNNPAIDAHFAKNAITLADYNRISIGATTADVDAVLQGRCPITGENVTAGHYTLMITCQNRDGSNALFMIQNGRVVQRHQLGL